MAQEEEFENAIKRDVEARVREGVKAVLEEVLEEEMTEHLKAGYWLDSQLARRHAHGRYSLLPLRGSGSAEPIVPRCRLSLANSTTSGLDQELLWSMDSPQNHRYGLQCLPSSRWPY